MQARASDFLAVVRARSTAARLLARAQEQRKQQQQQQADEQQPVRDDRAGEVGCEATPTRRVLMCPKWLFGKEKGLLGLTFLRLRRA